MEELLKQLIEVQLENNRLSNLILSKLDKNHKEQKIALDNANTGKSIREFNRIARENNLPLLGQ